MLCLIEAELILTVTRSTMVLLNPDFPRIIWSFSYRGWQIEIDQSEDDGQIIYSVWANHATGCAVAVPRSLTREDAIRRAKKYVDWRLSSEVLRKY